jgi:hypothetical protein
MTSFLKYAANFGRVVDIETFVEKVPQTQINSAFACAEPKLRKFIESFVDLEGIRIQLSFVENDQINARAVRCPNGEYGIIIFMGYVYFLAGVIARSIDAKMLDLNLTGRPTPLHRILDLPEYMNVDAELEGDHWAVSAFDDDKGQFYPVFETALYWLVGHELTHILHGHHDERIRARLHVIEATDLLKESITYSKAMEIDADCGAASVVFMLYVLHKNGHEPDGKLSLYIVTLASLIALTVLLIGNGGNDKEVLTHPTNRLRRELLSMNIVLCAKSFEWSTDDDFRPMKIAEHDNFSTFMAGLGLGFKKAAPNWATKIDDSNFLEINTLVDELDVLIGARRRFPKPHY